MSGHVVPYEPAKKFKPDPTASTTVQGKIETFWFEDHYKIEIWQSLFRMFSKNNHPWKRHFTFFSAETLTLIFFIEGVQALSRSQNDKTSNIW